MQNLTLNDEEFQPERDVVAEERRWRTDNNQWDICNLEFLIILLFITHITGLQLDLWMI